MNLIERRRGIMPSEKHGSGTLSLYPNAYIQNDYQGTLSSGQNGCAPSTSGTYAQLKADIYNDIWIYYKINTSEIPSNATITSASLEVRCYQNNMTNAKAIPCSSKNELLSGISIPTSLSKKQLNLSSLTYEDFQNFSIKFSGHANTLSNNARIFIFGSTLTINYEY